MSSQQWKGQSRGGTFGTWCFVMLVKHVGLWAAYGLLGLVVPYFVVFAPKATRSTWRFCRDIRHLGICRSVVEVFASYYTFGQCLIDKMAVGQGQSEQFNFVHDNLGDLRNMLEDKGKAAIVLSAHVGAWEAGAPFFADFGKRMNVTMFLAEHEGVQQVIEREQRGRSFSVIPIGSDGLDSVMKVKSALDKGEFVCFMGDRFMTGSPTTRVSFMGRDAEFTMGPFRVAASLQVPVMFYFALRESGRTYRFFFDVYEPTPADKRDHGRRLLTRYVETLERVVKRYPRQWFNYYDYWKKE